MTELYVLYTVDYHPNVLCAWIYGEPAECMEKKSDAEVRAGVSKLLDIVFKKKFNVSPIKSILRYKRIYLFFVMVGFKCYLN